MERYRLKMNYLHPNTRLQEQKQRSADLEQKLRMAMDQKLVFAKQKLAIRIERMKGLSPLAKLNQGFSYVALNNGTTMKSVQDVNENDELKIYVTDGTVTAKVVGTIKEDYSGK